MPSFFYSEFFAMFVDMEKEIKRLMPDRFLSGSMYNTVMSALESNERSYGDDSKLFGFYLPDFQRGAVWSRSQQIRFLESVWLQLPIGSYIINRLDYGDHPWDHPYDNMLLDGQQRLRAIRVYMADEFPVFGYRFSEITVIDRRRWDSLPFPRVEVRETDLSRLKEIYNRFNFGGTPHTPDQMAK